MNQHQVSSGLYNAHNTFLETSSTQVHSFKATTWKVFPRALQLQLGVQTDTDP